MFINIRGAFGSGKSTIVYGVLEYLRNFPGSEETLDYITFEGKDKLFAHIISNPRFNKSVLFLGKYTGLDCGGADCLNWKGVHDTICDYIRTKSESCHIIIEGAIVSRCTRRYNNLALELKKSGNSVKILYLDTELEECIRRVIRRRENKHASKIAAGKTPSPLKEFNPKNLIGMHEGLQRSFIMTTEENIPVERKPSTEETIKELVREIVMADKEDK